MVSIDPHSTTNEMVEVVELPPSDVTRNVIVKVLIYEVLTITDRQSWEFKGVGQPDWVTSFKINPETW